MLQSSGSADIDLFPSANSKGDFKFKFRHDKEVSFTSFARAIERGDSKMVDKILEMLPQRVDFRDMMIGTSVLHVAARYAHGSIEKLLKYPHIKRLIDASDNTGATPLIVAVGHENLHATRVLLENGAKTKNYLHESNQTVLHIAAGLKDESILKEVLKYNDSPSFLNWYDKAGNTALLASSECDSQCSEILLKSGANHVAKNKFTERNILHQAVLHKRRDLLKTLVMSFPQVYFLSFLDVNGDSPLMLAYKLQDIDSALTLLRSTAGEQMVKQFPDILIETIKIGDEKLFDTVLNLTYVDHVSKYCNKDGDTALMVAVEEERITLVEKLLKKGTKVSIQKNECGKSILDKIESVKNIQIAKIILNADVLRELRKSYNADIESAYESLLRRDSLDCFIIFHQTGLFKGNVLSKSESPIFHAARRGNYGVFLYMLLSSECIQQSSWVSGTVLPMENDLLRMYLKRIIYASDLYVLTGKLPTNPKWNFRPHQNHLFKNNYENRNIFHACAIGGSLETIIFTYNYCEIFYPKECQKVDMQDKLGISPLHLAILSKKEEVAIFLIQKGASLVKKNFSRQCPMTAIKRHITEHQSLLVKAMKQCIVNEQVTFENGPKHKKSFSLNFYMLCPKNAPFSEVVHEITTLPCFEYQHVICHPLIEYFVWHTWSIVEPKMVMRFYVGFFATLLFSAYMTIKYCQISNPYIHLLGSALFWFSLWFNKLILWFQIPFYFVRATGARALVLKLNVLIPLLAIIFLTWFNGYDRTSLEVGGTAVLCSWLGLLFHGAASPIGQHVDSFNAVFLEMFRVLPTFFIVTFAFTLYFFTLFNGFIMYNNPLHAFLFTAYQIPQGSVDKIPSMYLESEPSTVTNVSNYSSLNVTGDPEDPVTLALSTEARSMLIEGATVVFYLLAAYAFSNMVTALTLRSGTEALLAKKARILSIKTTRINEYEKFLNGKLYKLLYKLNALWMVGVQPKAKETLSIPLVIYPIKTKDGFDIFKMKNLLTEEKDLVCNRKIPYLLQWIEHQNTNIYCCSLEPKF